MNDALLKLGIIQSHNQMIKQRNKEITKDKKIKELYLQYKMFIQNTNLSKDKIIFELKDEVKKLKSNNVELEKENKFYKESFEKIPNLIIKLLKIQKKY